MFFSCNSVNLLWNCSIYVIQKPECNNQYVLYRYLENLQNQISHFKLWICWFCHQIRTFLRHSVVLLISTSCKAGEGRKWRDMGGAMRKPTEILALRIWIGTGLSHRWNISVFPPEINNTGYLFIPFQGLNAYINVQRVHLPPAIRNCNLIFYKI